MEQTFPTYLELKHFIKENPCTTICEIRDKFKQNGKILLVLQNQSVKINNLF